MEKFASELLSNNRPINEIADEMCFLEYKNIVRQFVQEFGCTPSKYRKKYSKK
jgi:AraC-like DNA-binding protein